MWTMSIVLTNNIMSWFKESSIRERHQRIGITGYCCLWQVSWKMQQLLLMHCLYGKLLVSNKYLRFTSFIFISYYSIGIGFAVWPSMDGKWWFHLPSLPVPGMLFLQYHLHWNWSKIIEQNWFFISPLVWEENGENTKFFLPLSFLNIS